MSELTLEHKIPQRQGKTQKPAKPPFYITSNQWDIKYGSNIVGLGVPKVLHRYTDLLKHKMSHFTVSFWG